jgi:lipooligosaccharide transport system permease protein
MKVFYKLYISNLVINFIEPSLYLFAFGFGLGSFVQDINGMSYIKYIAPGMVAQSGLFAAAFECLYGTFVRMNFQKTFDAILTTPVNKEGVIIGEILYAATKTVVFSAIIMTVVYAARLIPTPWLPLALPFLFIGGMTFASMSMIVTSLVKGIESFNYYVTLVVTPLMLLSGVYFPLEGILRKVGFFSPFYHSAKICQLLAKGDAGNIWIHALMLFLMMTSALTMAIIMMKKRLSK